MSAQMAFAMFLLIVLLAVLLCFTRPKRKGPDVEINATVIRLLAREFVACNVHIDVKTFDGVVILGGQVREFDQAKRAVEIARRVNGVKSVDNRMSVRSDKG
jgi:hyperosmotically inducible protein